MASLMRALGSKVSDFYVKLEDPHRIFVPGDVVKGQVALSLSGQVRARLLRLRVMGRMHLNIDNKVKHTLLKSQVDLVQEQMLDARTHIYDFSIRLPATSLPSSVDFGKGGVFYSIECELVTPPSVLRSGRSTASTLFTVMDLIDISEVPRPSPRQISTDAKGKRREELRAARAIVEIDRGAYVRGDQLSVEVFLEHYAPIKNMKGVIVTLYRLSRFIGGYTPHSFRKNLAQSVTPIIVDPRTLRYHLTVRLRVPVDAFPTISNNIHTTGCQFKYFVEVAVDMGVHDTVESSHSLAKNGLRFFESEHMSEQDATMETTRLRREKSVKIVQFEIVIGTFDSAANAREQQIFEFPDEKRELAAREAVLYPSAPAPAPNGFQDDAMPSAPEILDDDANMLDERGAVAPVQNGDSEKRHMALLAQASAPPVQTPDVASAPMMACGADGDEERNDDDNNINLPFDNHDFELPVYAPR